MRHSIVRQHSRITRDATNTTAVGAPAVCAYGGGPAGGGPAGGSRDSRGGEVGESVVPHHTVIACFQTLLHDVFVAPRQACVQGMCESGQWEVAWAEWPWVLQQRNTDFRECSDDTRYLGWAYAVRGTLPAADDDDGDDSSEDGVGAADERQEL